MHDAIVKALNWRYAVRSFDTTKKISEQDLETILEAGRLAPSSFGLQPWKFAIVENPEKRARIQAAAWDQAQVTQASHLLVVLAKTDMDAAYIEQYVKDVATTRGIPMEALKGYHDMMNGAILPRSLERKMEWMAHQAYIPVGMMLETAALLNIDAAPMEGFTPEEVNKILDIPGYTACVLLCVGYRSPEDKAAGYTKVRMSKEQAIVRIS